jgi:4'-phosphopantetheinyl transferase EntD
LDCLTELLRALRAWFGPHAGVCVLRVGPDLVPEYELEAAAVAGAFPGRRSEFLAGRRCGRQAMRQIGFGPAAIGAGKRGQPEWPAGVVGSISHDLGLSLAVAGSSAHFGAMGIDYVGDWRKFSMDLAGLVFSRSEARSLSGAQAALKASVAFSAKEAVIKVVSSPLQRLVDFREIEIELEWDAQEFRALDLLEGGQEVLPDLNGHFFLNHGAVLTGLVVRCHPTRPASARATRRDGRPPYGMRVGRLLPCAHRTSKC